MAQEFHDRPGRVDWKALFDWIAAHPANSTLLLRFSRIAFSIIAGAIGLTIAGPVSLAAAGGVATAERQGNRPPILWADPGALENATRKICLNEPERCGKRIERPQPSGEFVFSAWPMQTRNVEHQLWEAILSATFWLVLMIGVALIVPEGLERLESITQQREKFISFYDWPPGLLDGFWKRYPSLTRDDVTLVSLGLKQFFIAHLTRRSQSVAMPSKVVGDLWREFIFYTPAYQEFCDEAFGEFMHHTPTIAFTPNRTPDYERLCMVWHISCLLEAIDPCNAERLPLLFVLDKQLNIPDGFHYECGCQILREAGEEARRQILLARD